MSKFAREMEARSLRAGMIRNAMREYEDAARAAYGSPYAAMSGVLEAMLTSLAADRFDSTEEVVRHLKRLAKCKMETV
jgi:hypothetical protein